MREATPGSSHQRRIPQGFVTGAAVMASLSVVAVGGVEFGPGALHLVGDAIGGIGDGIGALGSAAGFAVGHLEPTVASSPESLAATAAGMTGALAGARVMRSRKAGTIVTVKDEGKYPLEYRAPARDYYQYPNHYYGFRLPPEARHSTLQRMWSAPAGIAAGAAGGALLSALVGAPHVMTAVLEVAAVSGGALAAGPAIGATLSRGDAQRAQQSLS